MRISFQRKRASALIVTVFITATVAVTLVAVLGMVSSEGNMAVRSHNWNLALHVAEAGAEEALSQLAKNSASLTSDSWTLTGGSYQKQRSLTTDSYFVSAISTNWPPTITSQGFVRAPVAGNYISRTVQVTTTNTSGMMGIVAKGAVVMIQNGAIDSYDSSNPLYSTNGMYIASKATANGFIGTLSKTANALDISISGSIKGSVGAGAVGVLKLSSPASVGDAAWVSGHPGAVQAGHLNTAFTMSLPDVAVPFTGGYFAPGPGTVGGTNYDYALTGGDYQVTSMTLTSKKMIVSGNSRLYVTDTFLIPNKGSIYITPTAKLEMYLGNWFQISIDAVINPTGKPSQFAFYGLPTCSHFEIEENAIMVGTAYAPSTPTTLEDDGVLSGAGVFGTVNTWDRFKFHLDEALGGAGGSLLHMTSWTEP